MAKEKRTEETPVTVPANEPAFWHNTGKPTRIV